MRHGAYILARYSTDNQNTDTIEVQVQKCTEWCQAHNLPVLDVFADFAVSGMKDTRREYERMLQQLRAGGADTVVVYDQSRMFRKMTAWFRMREELDVLGVSVRSVTQPLIGGDLRDPAVFLNEGVTAIFSQIHALQTRQKVVEKMRWMAEHGQHTGGKPPLGYDVVDGKLAINENEAETVRLIFSRYAAGVSYRDIIRELNSKGIRTKRGNLFGTNSLHDLLRNEKYIGVYTYGNMTIRADGKRNHHGPRPTDMIRVEGGCPQIVDRETFEKVQLMCARNKRNQGGRPTSAREYPLKGKVFCGACKSALSVEATNGYYYYVCCRRKRTGECTAPKCRVDTLEEEVFSAVYDVLGTPGNLERIVSMATEHRADVALGVDHELRSLLDEYKSIVQQLDAGTNAVLKGLHSETLERKLHELESRKCEIDLRVKDLKKITEVTSVSNLAICTAFEELIRNPAGNRSLLFSCVRRVEVYEDHLLIWTILDPNDPVSSPDASELIVPTSSTTNFIETLGSPSGVPTVIITPHYLIINCARKNGRN